MAQILQFVQPKVEQENKNAKCSLITADDISGIIDDIEYTLSNISGWDSNNPVCNDVITCIAVFMNVGISASNNEFNNYTSVVRAIAKKESL